MRIDMLGAPRHAYVFRGSHDALVVRVVCAITFTRNWEGELTKIGAAIALRAAPSDALF